MGTSEIDEFLSDVLPLQHHADTALLHGDPGPRKAFWSHRDPVTVLGAMASASAWTEVERLFDWLVPNLSNGQSYKLHVLAAGVSADLGYVVGWEQIAASGAGEAAPRTLRVTLVFRRENGTWKAVHRHAGATSFNGPALAGQQSGGESL